ncbi:MAG: hypothetical protein ACJ8CN_12150, partial [Gemmatimonadales bacterium]
MRQARAEDRVMKLKFRVHLLTILLSLTTLTVLLLAGSTLFNIRHTAQDLSGEILGQACWRIDRRTSDMLREAERQNELTSGMLKKKLLSVDEPAGLVAYWWDVMKLHPEV